MLLHANRDEPVATAALPPDSSRLQRLLQTQKIEDPNVSFSTQVEVTMIVRGVPERLTFEQAPTLVLGRCVFADSPSDHSADIDLEPYGASQRGVSRAHARLDLLSHRYLYITDLNSTNGTYVNGKRLRPYEPTILSKADKLVLGRLPIQIFFEDHPSLTAL